MLLSTTVTLFFFFSCKKNLQIPLDPFGAAAALPSSTHKASTESKQTRGYVFGLFPRLAALRGYTVRKKGKT